MCACRALCLRRVYNKFDDNIDYITEIMKSVIFKCKFQEDHFVRELAAGGSYTSANVGCPTTKSSIAATQQRRGFRGTFL